jgi:hypothetical protein
MFDDRIVNNFRYLLEEAVRDYSRAKNENDALKLLIGQAMLEGNAELNDRMEQYRAQFSDNELTMNVAKDQFEFTKTKLLAVFNNLVMPE